MRPFTYLAYGLHISSDLACPELASHANGRADVRVRLGHAPLELAQPQAQGECYQITRTQLLLKIDHVGRYLVSNGNEIVVERAPEASEDDVRVFLLGSVLGALLHQRGVLPLHASAIETAYGAVAFAGQIGHGKSTLAAAFHARGYRVLADDVCAVALDAEGKPLVMPAYPQLNLWADALAHIGESKDALRRSRVLTEKYGLPVSERFATRPAPLCAVYELNTTNSAEPSLARVTGNARLWLLRDNTFRLSFLAGMDDSERYLRMALAVAQHILTVRVSRPCESFLLDELADLVESDLRVAFGSPHQAPTSRWETLRPARSAENRWESRPQSNSSSGE
jgi:hypothetical protein